MITHRDAKVLLRFAALGQRTYKAHRPEVHGEFHTMACEAIDKELNRIARELLRATGHMDRSKDETQQMRTAP